MFYDNFLVSVGGTLERRCNSCKQMIHMFVTVECKTFATCSCIVAVESVLHKAVSEVSHATSGYESICSGTMSSAESRQGIQIQQTREFLTTKCMMCFRLPIILNISEMVIPI